MLPRPEGGVDAGVEGRLSCRMEGYPIVTNLGNHSTDLFDANSGMECLLPNYNVLD